MPKVHTDRKLIKSINFYQPEKSDKTGRVAYTFQTFAAVDTPSIASLSQHSSESKGAVIVKLCRDTKLPGCVPIEDDTNYGYSFPTIGIDLWNPDWPTFLKCVLLAATPVDKDVWSAEEE